MTPPEMLAEVGRSLYGERWQLPLADDLGINRETIRRWLSGHTPLPADHGVFADVAGIICNRRAELAEISKILAGWQKKSHR